MSHRTTSFFIATLLLGGIGCAPPDEETPTEGVERAVVLDTGILSGLHGDAEVDGNCVLFLPCVDRTGLFTTFDAPARGRLRAIHIWSGDLIDGIRLVWQDENDPERLIWSEHMGGHGGTLKSMFLQPSEAVVSIEGRSADLVDGLVIRTNFGRSRRWGGGGGHGWTENVGQFGREIHGMMVDTVKGNSLVGRIGFYSYEP